MSTLLLLLFDLVVVRVVCHCCTHLRVTILLCCNEYDLYLNIKRTLNPFFCFVKALYGKHPCRSR